MNRLSNNGIVYTDANGGVKINDTFEQIQQSKRQRQEEQKLGEQLAEENQQLGQHIPHQERRRAGNQLEAIEQWNQDREVIQPRQSKIVPIMLESYAELDQLPLAESQFIDVQHDDVSRSSVILVDHDMNQYDEQIQVQGQQDGIVIAQGNPAASEDGF